MVNLSRRSSPFSEISVRVNLKMRPSLRCARVASELFPTPGSVLPASDPWCLPPNFISTSSPSKARLAAVLTKKDVHAGWDLFMAHRKQFSSSMLSRLLAILPSGAESAHLWWPRALQIRDAIAAANRSGTTSSTSAGSSPTGLSTGDYAVLLNLASSSAKFAQVESLWTEMTRYGIPRDTNAWNQYIAAACDADPRFWPWPRSRSTSFARQVSRSSSKTLRRDALSKAPVREEGHVLTLLDRMEVEGVAKNQRTYELMLLALAREGFALGNPRAVSTLSEVVRRLWANDAAGNASLPSRSALTAIINSFGLHSQLVLGWDLVRMLADRYGATTLGLNTLAAHEFWRPLLRLTVAQTEPRNNVPTSFFPELWAAMTTEFGYVPSVGCQSIRLEYLEMKNQFEAMINMIPEILKLAKNSSLSSQGTELAQRALHRGVVGLANTQRALDALRLLQWARSLGLEPSQDLEKLLADRGVTLEQLRLFEEDDDEDNLI